MPRGQRVILRIIFAGVVMTIHGALFENMTSIEGLGEIMKTAFRQATKYTGADSKAGFSNKTGRH